MGHCVDCYGTNTIVPCATAGCISTNYGKCITYSGVDLYCALGAIGTFTPAGTAVVPGTVTVYTLGGTNVSGTGTGATFEVTRTPGSDAYTVKIANRGSGYAVGNQVKILGTSLGGATPANDVTFTIVTLNPVIPSGATLDSIIATFHNGLCASVAGGGIDYSALNYSCLRQNGVLTGIGSVITTEAQFVNSASAALCALNTTLNAYDTTVNISAFTNVGSLPGVTSPYNLNEVLGGVATAIVNVTTGLNYASITSNPCVAYAFTTKPSTSVVADYFNWITTNMCGMYQDLAADITSVTTIANSLKTYISGGSAVPANINTSVLSGGSSTSTASAALILLVSQVDSLNTSVSSLTTNSLSLTWASCFGGTYASNSVFKTQSWNWSNASVSLQTQMDRIVSVLSTLNLKFDATQFTITTGACGPTIALAAGVAFSSASLNACLLDNLGDVTTPAPSGGHFLVYDANISPNNWRNKSLTMKLNGSGIGIARTDTATDVEFDFTVVDTTPSAYSFTGVSAGNFNVTNASRFPIGSVGFPHGYKHGGAVTLHGVVQLNITGSFTLAHLASLNIMTVPIDIRPSDPVYFNVEMYVKVGSTYSNVYTRATASLDTAGNFAIVLMNPAGSLSLTTGDLVEIVIGGNSYIV
jgi:hypothetical protein